MRSPVSTLAIAAARNRALAFLACLLAQRRFVSSCLPRARLPAAHGLAQHLASGLCEHGCADSKARERHADRAPVTLRPVACVRSRSRCGRLARQGTAGRGRRAGDGGQGTAGRGRRGRRAGDGGDGRKNACCRRRPLPRGSLPDLASPPCLNFAPRRWLFLAPLHALPAIFFHWNCLSIRRMARLLVFLAKAQSAAPDLYYRLKWHVCDPQECYDTRFW